MTTTQDQAIDLHEAMQRHLLARPVTKSIGTLLQSKRKIPNFAPYYQRNYVWDADKATYFIESVLLGIEIPPLVIFDTKNTHSYEVIDGRQRFETLLRFYQGELKLTAKGLFQLQKLKGCTYNSLQPEIQRIFLDTTLRTIEFSTYGDFSNQTELEDLIKKEIFWRYNSGITPIKASETQKDEDSFTQRIQLEIEGELEWVKQFKHIFFAKQKTVNNGACIAKIRELLILDYLPINLYASAGRTEWIEQFNKLYIEQSEEQDSIIQSFANKIDYLYQLYLILQHTESLIYQDVLWIISILDRNGFALEQLLDHGVIVQLSEAINNQLDLFIGAERHFNQQTQKRFDYLATSINKILQTKGLKTINFNQYLHLSSRSKNVRFKESAHDSNIDGLGAMRLYRPDVVSVTIEDLLQDTHRTSFSIRPPYHPQEVINSAKSSCVIESMLLGIPLPTLFIYRRNDGACEVIDGQQKYVA